MENGNAFAGYYNSARYLMKTVSGGIFTSAGPPANRVLPYGC